jgi:hypothetical protein
VSDQAATEATKLDKSRRYLRPVAGYGTHEAHLSVYAWLPAFEAWATGMSLCGGSMRQGPLPEGTAVTCEPCEGYRPTYERMLAPGYNPGDDDPKILRARIAQAIALHQPIGGDGGPYCDTCTQEEKQPAPTGWWVPFPCPTVRALTGESDVAL